MEPDAADLVEQLKNNATALWLFDPQDELPALMNQAAKEIERLRAGLASPSEERMADMLNAAAEIMVGWPKHAAYTRSGRGLIAVQELRWLAGVLAALRTKEGEDG